MEADELRAMVNGNNVDHYGNVLYCTGDTDMYCREPGEPRKRSYTVPSGREPVGVMRQSLRVLRALGGVLRAIWKEGL
jgi:hypothetical protein